MNRTLKRVLGLSGSVVLGLAGAVTFASAAQAHHVTVEGEAQCLPDGSGWIVNWEATDWQGKPGDVGAGTVTGYTINTGTVSGDLFVEDPNPVLPEFGSETPLGGVQTLSLEDATASLSLSGEWTTAHGNRTNTTEPMVIPQPEGGCEGTPNEPTYGLHPDVNCVGIGIEAYNVNPDALNEFTFVSSDGEEHSDTPAIDDVFSAFFLIEEPEAGLSVDIFVNDELVDTVEWYDNELCSYINVEADCEGLTFTLSVPDDGEPTTFFLLTSYNDEPEEITIQPGGSEVREFNAVEGVLWVDYYIQTLKDGTEGGVEWIPCDEETPSPSPSGTPSAQPQLPTTGSSMTIMIGSAAALIVAAAAIFLIMRRRRAAQDW